MLNRILIIDDDAGSLMAIKRLLMCVRYDVRVAQDVSTGIRLAEETLPHLILMNIHMPVMNGLEITRYLKMQPATHLIPIIALTADVYSYEACMAAGCSAYLNKPVRRAELLYAIQQWLQPVTTASLAL